MLSPNRFLIGSYPSLPLRDPPTAGPLFLCAVLLAAVVAPPASRAQCPTAATLKPAPTHSPLATDSDAPPEDPIPDLPSWPPSFNVQQTNLSWSHARGRAVLSTIIPTLVGGTLLRVRPDDRTTNTLGLSIGGAGLLIGPSTGQWCLGGRYNGDGVRHTTVRLAGAGGLALALDWGKRTLEEVPPLATFFVVGPIAVVVGLAGTFLLDTVLWTIKETPPRACTAEGNGPVAVSQAADASTGGRGVRLSVRF